MASKCNINTNCMHLFKEFVKQQEAEQKKNHCVMDVIPEELPPTKEEVAKQGKMEPTVHELQDPTIMVTREDEMKAEKHFTSGNEARGVQDMGEGDDTAAITETGDSSVIHEANYKRIAFTNSPFHMSVVF